ncbi:MAG: hypothetical protein Q8P15_01390 [Nanoarchaeota archaeon]|nr:hypothetical protein [Nanoarchaeota archaeon]
MKARIGKSYLEEIPHENGKRTFQYPAFRGTYGNVAEAIDKEGLKRPNSPETASLVYDAFQNRKGEYESEIIKILKDAWFWEFTGNIYLPKSNEEINNGVILEHYPKITNGKLDMNKDSLIKRLRYNDSNVKFVPFGYKIGEQNLRELEKNPYIIARYGEEGAQKITEVASKYKKNPKLWSFDSVDEEKARISALSGSWDLGRLGASLGVDGGWIDVVGGHAFGVCAPAKSE